LTVPLPVPLAPDVIVIQPTLLLAVQAHPPGAVTLTVPLPPLELYDLVVADSEYVQATPPSVTVKVWPAMVTVPVSALELLLAATE
jgi:hypothetical protein